MESQGLAESFIYSPWWSEENSEFYSLACDMRAPEDLTRIIRIQKTEQLDSKNVNSKVKFLLSNCCA